MSLKVLPCASEVMSGEGGQKTRGIEFEAEPGGEVFGDEVAHGELLVKRFHRAAKFGSVRNSSILLRGKTAE